MHPVLQIRIDELPEIPPALEGIALITIWMDLRDVEFWDLEHGSDFFVRTYSDLENLVPLEIGEMENSDLPTLLISWRGVLPEQPSWEDMADKVPPKVAQSASCDWFFESKYMSERYEELRSVCPLKVGGWPTWVQGADWPSDAQFFLQVDSTTKGALSFGDAGSIYLFKVKGDWVFRGDCY